MKPQCKTSSTPEPILAESLFIQLQVITIAVIHFGNTGSIWKCFLRGNLYISLTLFYLDIWYIYCTHFNLAFAFGIYHNSD